MNNEVLSFIVITLICTFSILFTATSLFTGVPAYEWDNPTQAGVAIISVIVTVVFVIIKGVTED